MNDITIDNVIVLSVSVHVNAKCTMFVERTLELHGAGLGDT